MAKAEPIPKRGFGNSFQPAMDTPWLELLELCGPNSLSFWVNR